MCVEENNRNENDQAAQSVESATFDDIQNPAETQPIMKPLSVTRADGYRGIWYMNQPTKDVYKYKYSGGFATYPQQHVPIAIYAPAARKTFFVFGGTTIDTNSGTPSLLHMISHFDHKTKTVPRPVILRDKQTDDAHDNPTLSIDARGHLWVFHNAHGIMRPSFISRSVRPYDIGAWEETLETNFSYGQPWNLSKHGFVFLHTRYNKGRGLQIQTSGDGLRWDEPRSFAHIEEGSYQISWYDGASGTLATAFDFHPNKQRIGKTESGLNYRTNLHYLQSRDGGKTWTTAGGKSVVLPVTERKNDALVRDFEAEGLLVYLKDINFDAQGRPVILYLLSKGFESGPANGPRRLCVARWTGRGEDWTHTNITTCDHNYDHGSLYLEPNGTLRVIAPTLPGPQPNTTGGEIAVWENDGDGDAWRQVRQLTKNSPRNHTYVRRPLCAHDEFYALWADGNSLAPSESHLYFTNREAKKVFRLPTTMTGDAAKPDVL